MTSYETLIFITFCLHFKTIPILATIIYTYIKEVYKKGKSILNMLQQPLCEVFTTSIPIA